MIIPFVYITYKSFKWLYIDSFLFMKTIEQAIVSANPKSSPNLENILSTKVRLDHRTTSVISIEVNNTAHENEHLSLELPSVPIRKLIKKLERIIAEEEFKQINKEQFNRLTKREKQVLKLLALGYNNPKISDELNISRYTVESHHKSVNKKLNIRSYADLMKFSMAFELI